MTVHSQALARPRSVSITAILIVAVPIMLALICVLARFEIIELSQSVRAGLLFALLLALMATGMPISIALGLSVLTYLFILSSVDPKMVGLKLFTSIDRFEIMAIPFFILAGNFLTSGGVARRMIDFATAMIGHWYGGLGLAGVTALGTSLWLSTLNVRYRDIGALVPFGIQVWLFATPIVYPSILVPEPWRPLYLLNPMAGVVEGFRWAMLGTGTAPGMSLIFSSLISVVLLLSGAFYFRRMERTFADIV